MLQSIVMERVIVLDGLRAVAIVMVVCYHYFARWTEFYPYGSALAAPFAMGYLGVWLFFIISGFVIALTLESCSTFGEFALRRFARLWPPMLLCSIVTFATLSLVPQGFFRVSAANFLPSLTFVDPATLSKLVRSPLASMDGAYWSLYVEVRFYFWAALLFFLFRRGMVAAFLVFMNAVALLDVLTHHLVAGVFAPQYMPVFGIGVGFHYLYRSQGDRLAALLALDAAALSFAYMDLDEWLVCAGFVGLFATLIYRPKLLAPLAWKPVTALGQASYSLYLLHQYAGVALIGWISSVSGLNGRAAIPVAVAVIAGMVAASGLLYKVWEIPARKRVREVFSGFAARSPRAT